MIFQLQKMADHIVSLPLYNGMETEKLEYVINVFNHINLKYEGKSTENNE